MLHKLFFLDIFFILFCVVHTISSPNFDFSTRLSVDVCSTQNRTAYLRTSGVRLEGVPPLKTFSEVSLFQCAQKCTESAKTKSTMDFCRSFEYNSEELLCTLKSEDSQPLGRGVLDKTEQYQEQQHNNPTTSSIAFFQRICLPIGNLSLCPSAHTFERFPQHVLIGHSLEVLIVAGLSECLAKCLTAKQGLGIECQSVMYFYESGTCILNRERRQTAGLGMFRPEEGTELVDYLENVCFDVECAEGSEELHWIRTEHFQIDPSREMQLGDKLPLLEQCSQMCRKNRLDDAPFPCKAFVYSASSGQCQLSAESGIIRNDPKHGTERRRNKRRRQIPVDGEDNNVDDGEDSSLPKGIKMGFELSAFSAGQYHEKVCLSPKISANCTEMATFELFPSKTMNLSGNVESRKLIGITVADCLKECLTDSSDCRSVQFRRDRDECVLNPISQLTHPELFHSAKLVDYYDNLCIPSKMDSKTNAIRIIPTSQTAVLASSTPTAASSGNGKFALASLILEKQKIQRPEMEEGEGEGNWKKNGRNETEEKEGGSEEMRRREEKGKEKLLQSDGEQMNEAKAVVSSECGWHGIEVEVRFGAPSSGILFLRDHSANCIAHFRKAIRTVLQLPFPLNRTNECPGTLIGPHLWTFVVVLQQQKEEIDPPLLTGQERVFNITCNFGTQNADWEENNTTISSDITSSSPYPPTADLSSSPNPFQLPKISLSMSLLRDGIPINAVKLGEELELRWTIVKESSGTGLGMSVSSCVADRIGGDSPVPPPLPLIVDGCPAPKVLSAHLINGPIQPRSDGFSTSLRMFRFDGSRRVRIRCAVNICMEKCLPINCTMIVSDVADASEELEISGESRRRRRRSNEVAGKMGATTLGELAELVERYDRMRGQSKRAEKNGRIGSAPARSRSGPADPKQQSTTISGSYTILENDGDEEDDQQVIDQKRIETDKKPTSRARIQSDGRIRGESGDKEGEKSLKRISIMRKGGKEDRAEDGEEDKAEKTEEASREELITLVGNGKKLDEIGKMAKNGQNQHGSMGRSKTEECTEDDSRSFCIARSLAVLAIILFITMAAIQCFQIWQFLRKKRKIKNEKNCAEIAPIEEQHPPAPIWEQLSTLESQTSGGDCGFRTAMESVKKNGDNGTLHSSCWHKSKAMCAQDCATRHAGQRENTDNNCCFHRDCCCSRRHSVLSWADEDQIVEELENIERQTRRQQQQTVFPAEPIPPRASKRRMMEPV